MSEHVITELISSTLGHMMSASFLRIFYRPFAVVLMQHFLTVIHSSAYLQCAE